MPRRIDTSIIETASSAISTFGFTVRALRDHHALALAAGQLVRVLGQHAVRIESDEFEQFPSAAPGAPRARGPAPPRRAAIRSGSRNVVATVRVGFSTEYGS